MSCQKNMEAYFSYKKIKNGSPEREKDRRADCVVVSSIIFLLRLKVL